MTSSVTRRLTLIWFVNLFVNSFLLSQPINNLVKDVVMPPPNAASLGKFGDIPVSYFTGVPNVGIPITTVQEGSLALSVSLNYHASGIKVAETASWVGLGWSLVAGGTVSRTIQGLADDTPTNGYYNFGANVVICSDPLSGYQATNAASGTYDLEPDIFSFNFAGYSGKFFFDKDKVCQFLPKQELKLVPYTTNDPFTGFTIITPDGTRFIFGKTDLPAGSSREAYDISKSPGENIGQKVTWHLVRVESYDQKFAIDLYYNNDNYSYRNPASCRQLFFPGGCGTQQGQYVESTNCSTTQGVDYAHRYIWTSITGKRLSKIVTSTSVVEFIANTDRQDLDQLQVAGSTDKKELDTIKVYPLSGQNPNMSYCFKYALSQSYMVSSGATGSEAKRLVLDQIQKTSCDGAVTEPAYIFTYEPGQLPFRLSKQVDHWGYFNGQTGNEDDLINIPPTTYEGFTYGSSNRNTSESNMKKGVLTEITYPTGGKTQFTFEANKIKGATQGSQTYLPNSFWIKTCNNPADPLCCGIKTQSATYTFVGQNMDSVWYKLNLTRLVPPASTCNGQPPSNVVVELIIRLASNNQMLGYTSFNLATNQPFYNKIGLIKAIAPTLQNNISYKFEVKSTDGFAYFEMYSQAWTTSDVSVGGLRVASIRNKDAVSNSNDIVRNYEYKNENDNYSSGRLLDIYLNVPRYVTQAQGTIIFSDVPAVPLSTFGYGYHLGYERVKETLAGNEIENQSNGYSIYKYFWTLQIPDDGCDGFNGFYPAPPPTANPAVGELLSMHQYNASNSLLSYTINNYETLQYTFSSGNISKVAPADLCPPPGGGYYAEEYRIRQYIPLRIQSVSKSIDGVVTVTSYQYDSQNRYLSPKAILVTNSDNQVTKTEYRYPVLISSTCLKNALLNRNIRSIPTSTNTYVGSTLVNGDSTIWTTWSSTGYPNATCNSSNIPYPWKFYRYEMTYNSSGNATTGTWDMQGFMNCRYVSNGLPKKFTMTCSSSDTTCWKPELYEWGAGGIITKKTYNNDASTYKNFVTQYDYHAGTRLVSKITDVDGQFKEFTYDKLQRLSSVKARKVSSSYKVQTDYTYQFKTTGVPRSYVKARTTFASTAGSSLTEKTVWQYFDGIGRLVQTVDQKHSPDLKDVIFTQTYDNQGRQDTAFVVFEKPSISGNNNGDFYASIPSGSKFTLTQYDSNPLNRVWKVTPPSWFPTIYTYGANATTDSVYNYQGSALFNSNLLNKAIVEDPNGNKTITFIDKKGRVLLSRRTNNAGSWNSKANTYNIYDNKDRLNTVIPPGASIANTDLIFKYLYDAADNMTVKDLPDAAAMSLKYNTRNLMTLMQDGNLASQTKWLGTEYDLYGRPIKTGFVTGTSPNPNTFSFSEVLTETVYDDVAGSQAIYKGKVKQSKAKVLDGGATFLTTDYTYDAHGRVATSSANNFTSGSDNFAFTYDWADNRLTNTRTHKRLSTDATTTVLETSTYDHAGRLKENKHKLNTDAEKTVSYLNYNFKDELIEKNLGYVSSTNTLQSLDYTYNEQGWLRTINNASLGGTNIAFAACPTTMPNPGTASSTPDNNDLFYLELFYDFNLFGTPQKNGNIAKMNWRTRGRQRQGYSFNYDYLDRLTNGTHYDISDAGSNTQNNRYNEVISYSDARGNIATLSRYGGKLNASNCWEFNQIDNLTYAYTANTNKISSISDAASSTWKSKGFNPGTGSGSYAYDVNGNMTSDPYKAMTVAYNHLNLPKLMTFTSEAPNKTIDILYDASGMKLKKIVKTGTTTNYTQEYYAGIEYRDGVREAIYHVEGRLFNNSGTNRYEYSIRDHLGNTRLTFTDKDGNGKIDVTTTSSNEILNELHYYPFGLTFEGAWMNDNSAIDYKYQYNGKEWNEDFGLNWLDYGARWYDAASVTWLGVDPLAEKYGSWSPFNYVLRNPVRFIDPDGKAADDFVLLIAKEGAGGHGHMGAVIQDGKGSYYYVTQGAVEIAGVSKMSTQGVQGGMSVQILKGATTMEEAIGLAKQDDKNSPYTDEIQFETSSETDQKIFDNITELANDINSGEKEYNVMSMNCTDAIERPIENATGADLPDDPRPNKNFEKVKNNRNEIQNNIDLSSGRAKVEYIPSGLDNVPTHTRSIIIPNNKQ